MAKPILPTLVDNVHGHRNTLVAIKRLHGYTGDLEGRLTTLETALAIQTDRITAAQAQSVTASRQAAAGLTPPSPPPDAGPLPVIPPASSPADLAAQFGTGSIHVAGLIFQNAALAPWKWAGSSEFKLYYLYLNAGGSAGGGAAAIAPILAQRAGLGFTNLRVFSMLWNIVHFDPAAFPAYLSDLPIFAAQCAAAGFQIELTILADCQLVPNMATTAQQGAHVTRVTGALSGSPNILLDLGNEWPGNGWTPGLLPRPLGPVCSAGSNNGGGAPPRPAWDWCTYHTPRDTEWPRKAKDLLELRDGFAGWTPLLRPVVADEPIGAAEVAIPGSRSDVPDDFFWFAATAMMMGAGATFHSDNGIQSVLFQPVQLACATAFMAGISTVPVAAQTWTYTRGGLADFPLTHDDTWYLRGYCKYDAHNAVVILIRPTGLWPGPVVVAPWVLVSATGPGGTYITLSR